MDHNHPLSVNVHRRYEELCALVAAHEASDVESDQLQEHLEQCAQCRDLLRELQGYFADECAQVNVPHGMTEAFMNRLHRSAGQKGKKTSGTRQKIVLWLALATVAIAAMSVVSVFQTRRKYEPHASKRPTVPTSTPISRIVQPTKNPSVDNVPPENSEILGKLRQTQAEANASESQLRAAEKRLQEEDQERQRLSSDLATSKEELKVAKADSETRIGQLENELKALRDERDVYRDAAQGRLKETTDLRTRLVAEEAKIDEQQRLIATGNLTWELLVGRNTHRMDVYDTDSNGQTSSGRIYYAEGKKLVFIAYDLSDTRRLAGDVSFYAWGEKLGATHPVERLGIFHVENEKDRRWILTCDDARVLAQINSVFVTMEPSQNAVTRPRGKKILSARLDKPGHP